MKQEQENKMIDEDDLDEDEEDEDKNVQNIFSSASKD